MAGSIAPYYTPLDATNPLHVSVIRFLESDAAINIYKWLLPISSMACLLQVCKGWQKPVKQVLIPPLEANIQRAMKLFNLLFCRQYEYDSHACVQHLVDITKGAAYVDMRSYLDKIEALQTEILNSYTTLPEKFVFDSFIKLLKAAGRIDQKEGEKFLNYLKKKIHPLVGLNRIYFNFRVAELERHWNLIGEEKLLQAQAVLHQAIRNERDTHSYDGFDKQQEVAWIETALNIEQARQSLLKASNSVTMPKEIVILKKKLKELIVLLEDFGDERQHKEASLFLEIVEKFSQGDCIEKKDIAEEERLKGKKMISLNAAPSYTQVWDLSISAIKFIPINLEEATETLGQANSIFDQIRSHTQSEYDKNAIASLKKARAMVLVETSQQPQINQIEKLNALKGAEECLHFLFENTKVDYPLTKYILVLIREIIKT